MAELQNSRVAELMFTEIPHCNFARTIGELGELLTRICGDQCKTTWDYDDVASFDMPGTRIVLSYSDSPYEGYVARLVLSVGPSGIAPVPGQSAMIHTALCSKMVNRLQQRCKADEIRWRSIAGIVSAEEIDKLVEVPAAEIDRAEKPRANIFTQSVTPDQSGDHSAELQPLRMALRPYRIGADLPAASFRLASQTIDLASAMAQLPFAAAHYAVAAMQRSAAKSGQLPR